MAAFVGAGLVISNSKLDHFFSEVDTNHDGVISFDEWRLVLKLDSCWNLFRLTCAQEFPTLPSFEFFEFPQLKSRSFVLLFNSDT